MNMYKYTLILSIGLLFGCAASSDLGIKVEGNVTEKVPGAIVTLMKFETAGFVPVDTIYVDEEGNFRFYVQVSSPEFFRLNFYNRQQLNLILDGSEEVIRVQAQGSGPNGIASVEGSVHTGHVQEIDAMMKAQQEGVQALNQQAIQARMDGDQVALESITDEYYLSLEDNNKELKNYIRKIAPSLAGFYGLNALETEAHFEFMKEIASTYEEALPEHPFTVDLVGKVDALQKLSIGAPAPEISLPNPDGEIVTLSSLKGNYVLIDFWAAWCRPCRAENPNVVRMYNEYSENNFEILGVSLDRNRESWLKAIEDDGLVWKHISDLKYFNSEAAASYQINAIPATYLIDPEGNILAKGLRGPSLEAKLKEIFG